MSGVATTMPVPTAGTGRTPRDLTPLLMLPALAILVLLFLVPKLAFADVADEEILLSDTERVE